MNVLHAASDLNANEREVCLAIGFFDGVHLGHQEIIRQTLADAHGQNAVSLVITFDRHPNSVVAPNHLPPLIYPLAKKLAVIDSLGVENLLLIRFDKAFSEQRGEDFIRNQCRELGGFHSLCVGADFTFGHKRSGNVALLQRLGNELGFAVHGLPAVMQDGKVIRSTRIREAIRAGDVGLASQMLGRAYTLSAQVISGDGLGRKFGFPTANLDVAGLALPPNGVYAVSVVLHGRNHHGVLNMGYRPTLNNPASALHAEVHLLNFDKSLYGENLEVEFIAKLRDEKKFPSITDLKEQIARDIEAARCRF